jgi:N-acetylmuramic acid 6-phosphate etherase
MSRGEPLVLGIEGGGTKTEWVLLRPGGSGATLLAQGQLAAANLRLASDDSLRVLLSQLRRDVSAVGVFLAGCGTEADRRRLSGLAREIWPHAAVSVGSDRDSSLAACFAAGDGIVVIAGTGSAVTGRHGGRLEKAGGRGHLLGDKGGAYDLVLEGLCAGLKRYDLEGNVSPLLVKALRGLAQTRLDELVLWVQQASSTALAALAPLVFEAAGEGDAGARAVIEEGAQALAQYARAVAQRLELDHPAVGLAGGVFLAQPTYVQIFRAALAPLAPGASVSLCRESGALGAARLAGAGHVVDDPPVPTVTTRPIEALAAASTEARHPQSQRLDTLAAPELVALFLEDQPQVEAALRAAAGPLAAALEAIASSLQAGGRLFYVGAGTSGRLGVLDASEMPPTFGLPSDRVQGIIAGGAAALHSSVEGAEDQREDGAAAVVERGVRAGDVLCGITASGRTPFTLAALAKGRQLGARTILLSCNPARTRSSEPWDVEIDLPTGAELLTGSTRLKAGTATKVALNILSTGAMVRLGRVKGNLMLDMRVTSAKLRDRAARMVAQERRCSHDEAVRRLEACGWDVRRAVAGLQERS